MRRHLLASAILFAVHTAHAADAPTLPTLQVQAAPPSRIDSRVTVDNPQAQNRTLGGLLEHVSGVQNSAFGPNAAPRSSAASAAIACRSCRTASPSSA